MIQSTSVFLALRYLRPRRSFVSAITFLSILGPIIGVAVLIVVLAVMAGFNRDIRQKILGMQAHIHLRHVLDQTIAEPGPMVTRLRELGVAASPMVEGPVLLQTRERILAKYVKGIVPEYEQNVTDIRTHIIEGRYELTNGEALIGDELAHQCGIRVGDRILVHSPEKLNKMVRFDNDGGIVKDAPPELYVPEELTVVGIFSMGMYEYDSSVLITHLDTADEMFGLDWGSAAAIQVRTEDPFNLNPILEKIAGDPDLKLLRPITWQQSNQRLFGALRVEKNLMFFLLTFIMIVAGFGIAATLITVVIEKTGEIGILKALGASPFTILAIFVLQGTIVGVLGTVGGTALGLGIVHWRNTVAAGIAKIMGTEIFPKELYHLSEIPAMVQTSDVIAVVVSALLICILGALVPAVYAAALTPSDAIRSEH